MKNWKWICVILGDSLSLWFSLCLCETAVHCWYFCYFVGQCVYIYSCWHGELQLWEQGSRGMLTGRQAHKHTHTDTQTDIWTYSPPSWTKQSDESDQKKADRAGFTHASAAHTLVEGRKYFMKQLEIGPGCGSLGWRSLSAICVLEAIAMFSNTKLGC